MRKTLTCVALFCAALGFAAEQETVLYSTTFQDWENFASSTTPATKTVTTAGSKEQLTFTFAETQIDNVGTNSKFTNVELITKGYAKCDKSATPYIETSVLKNVTSVHYVHAATGGSRGWGLLVKGVHDTEWDTVSSTVALQAGSAIDVAINRDSVQLRWYNLNASQNAYMTELSISGMFSRDFNNFEIDLSANPVVLPAGVEQVNAAASSYNGAQHGWVDYTIQFAVDGPVAMTFGGCQYANRPATVTSKTTGALLGTIDTKAPGCYNAGAGVATWTYNVEAADTLVVYLGQYSPYFKAEACAYIPNYVITYFDQNDKLLGRDTVAPSTPFAPLFTADSLTLAQGEAFRGWLTPDGIKVVEGTAVNSDLRLFASVSEIETAEVGKYYTYDMTKVSWYQEDHECITITNGAYHNTHGWLMKPNGTIALAVTEKAYVQIKNCLYSAAGNIVVTRLSNNDTVTTIALPCAVDGKDTTFYYEGTADTLLLTFPTQAYVHSISIYNVTDAIARHESGLYVIPAGDASSFLLTLLQLQKGDRVFLPNGIYDLGEKVLTPISVDSISIIGQSMEGTIILNAPDASMESINNTATILLTGNYCYFQDLTIQNALDYYKANNGRAVTLQDKATGTICKNVRLLSYQDTYYSNKIGAVRYFEGGSIHGTVDYICGDGSVFFEGVELFCEKRSSAGGGSDAVTASNATAPDKGYVFNNCILRSECPTVSLGRSWNNIPQTIFLNTVFDYSYGNFSLTGNGIQRWTVQGMNVVPERFGEYNSVDTAGNVISPASNIVNFYKDAVTKSMETILSAEEAATYDYATFFGTWDPKADTRQEELTYTVSNGQIVWAPTTATLFLVETATGYELTTTLPTTLQEGDIVRAANVRGGFGAPAVNATVQALNDAFSASATTRKIVRNGQVFILHNGQLFDLLGNAVAK